MSEHNWSPSWADRHPAAAATAGLFSLTLMCMMFSEHPVAALTVTAVCALGAGVWLLDRERDRRAATAARADAANRELLRLMNAPKAIRLNPAPNPRGPALGGVASRHVMNRFPTTPLDTHPMGARR
jgi:uncharacterized membrane protein